MKRQGILCIGILVILLLNLFGIFFISSHTLTLTTSPSHLSPSSSNSQLTLSPPSPSLQSPHIFIIIRSHYGYRHQLFSLLYSFLSQSIPMSSLHLFILPTDLPSLTSLSEYLDQHWDQSIIKNQFFYIQFMNLSSQIFQQYCCQLQSLCNPLWVSKKLSDGYPLTALTRYCEINNPLHYHLTDLALESVLSSSLSTSSNKNLTYQFLIITNADNFYSPKFLELTIEKMNLDNLDLLLTNMIHLGKPMEVAPELGKMDLGCAIIRLEFLYQHGITFVSSLPIPTEPQHWHDADYWLIQKMIDHGARVDTLPQFLFNHN